MRNRGNVPLTKIANKIIRKYVLKITHIAAQKVAGSIKWMPPIRGDKAAPSGAFSEVKPTLSKNHGGSGLSPPPRKITVAIVPTIKRFVNSARKKIANLIPLYSVL